MAVTAEQIADKLKETLDATTVVRTNALFQIGPKWGFLQEVEDTSGGCGSSFRIALVVSPQFEQKGLLARHKAINSALKDEIAQIHALQISQCRTPSEMDKNA
jgi:stress-induced morphogen